MKIASNSLKAKKIIRDEIKSYDWNAKRLKKQIDDFMTYPRHSRPASAYQAGKKLVEGGCFACYYNQCDDMLNKIYGKDNVKKWNDQKKWDTYMHLVSREISNVYDSGKMSLPKPKVNKSVKK